MLTAIKQDADGNEFVDQQISMPILRLFTTATEIVVNNQHVHMQLWELMHTLAKPDAICANIMVPAVIEAFDGITCEDAEAHALRAAVRATLNVGGRICHRRHLDDILAPLQPSDSHVDVHTLETLCAQSYSNPALRRRAASITPPAFMVTVTWYATEQSLFPDAPPLMVPYACIERMNKPFDPSGGDWVHACAACANEALVLHVCSGCRKTRYCSQDCQASHWRTHKTWCRSVRTV